MHVRAVDLDPRDSAAAAANLVEEAAAIDGISESAWRDGIRWIRKLTRVSLPPPADPERLPLQRRGVYLITGGTGGMGLSIAKWLAENYQARLLLTSRKGSRTRRGSPRNRARRRGLRYAWRRPMQPTARCDVGSHPDIRSGVGAVSAWRHPCEAGVSGSGGLAALEELLKNRALRWPPKVGGLQVLIETFGQRATRLRCTDELRELRRRHARHSGLR